jgi:predicted TIM-barrel fold metal-dependent hydrolase
MTWIIDDNMHFLPPDLLTNKPLREAFINSAPREYGQSASVHRIPGTDLEQIVIEWPKGCENLNFGPIHVDPESRIAAMQEAGVDKAILRVPCWQEWIDLELCRKVNNDMAKYMGDHPGLFYGIAIVPPWGTEDSLKEVERCINDLGFVGVELAAHYGTLYLDEEEFKPYFRRLNELKIPVVVHHTPLPVDYDHLVKYTNFRRLFGRCVDQATAVGREIFSGMFDEFPNLKFVHTMLGGGFFAYVDMIQPKKSRVPEEMERFNVEAAEKVKRYLRDNLYFDISHAGVWGKAELECAVKVFGADHVLFGGSYPVRREWLIKGVEDIRVLDISDQDKELILGGNAQRIFNLK